MRRALIAFALLLFSLPAFAQGINYGNFATGATVQIEFNTFDNSGAPVALSGSPVISIYKDTGGTEVTTGVTLTASFDSRTGLNVVVIDTSSDGTFYAAGHEFFAVITTGTVSGVNVANTKVGHFSLQNRYMVADAAGIRSAVGLASANLDTQLSTIDDFVDTEVGAIKTKTDQLTFTVANQVDVNVLDWKSATAPAMTGDAFARLGAPAGASVSADIAAVKAVLPSALVGGRIDASVGAYQSGQAPLQPTVAGRTLDVSTGGEAGLDWANIGSPTTAVTLSGTTVKTATDVETDTQDIQSRLPAALDSNGFMKADVEDWKGATAPAMTGDAYARLGAPAGASVSADVAAVKADTAAIKAKTDNLPASPAATSDIPSAASVADAVWDEAQSGHTTSGTFGFFLDSQVSAAGGGGGGGGASAAQVWDYLTASIATSGSIGKLIKDNLDATVSSRSTYAGGDTAGTTTLLSRLTAPRASNLDNLDAAVSSRSTYAGADTPGTTTLLVRLPSAISLAAGAVTVGTNNDKTGYGLTSAYDPAKTAAQAGDAMALTSGERVSTAAIIWNALTSGFATSGSVGKRIADNLDVAISSRGTSNYAGADTPGTTTLLVRLPSAISLSGGAVTVGTNSDKTDYALTSAYDAAKTAAQAGDEMAIADDAWDSAVPRATVQAGSTASSVIIGAVSFRGHTVSDGDSNHWKDALVLFIGASCNVEGEVSRVSAFNGGTRALTISPSKTAAPNTSCEVLLVNR